MRSLFALLLAAVILFAGCPGQGPSLATRASTLADSTGEAQLLYRFDALFLKAGNCSQVEMDLLASKYAANSSYLYAQIQKINACGQALEKKTEETGSDAALVTYYFTYASPSCGSESDALLVTFNSTTNALSADWVDVTISRGDLAVLSSTLSAAEAEGNCGLALFFFS